MRSEWAPWPASSSLRFLLCGSESELGAIEGGQTESQSDNDYWLRPREGIRRGLLDRQQQESKYTKGSGAGRDL